MQAWIAVHAECTGQEEELAMHTGSPTSLRRGIETLEMKLAALRSLIEDAAHDVNNPLCVVAANAGYVLERLRALALHDEQLIEAQTEIESAVERIAVIVDSLRELGRGPHQRPHAPSGRRARLLLVDDDSHVLEGLRRILRDHDVTLCASADEAFATLEAMPTFDLIFSDLLMPSLSGMDLFERLIARSPELGNRFVFMTGGSISEDTDRFLARVPNQCLEKPIDPRHLRAFVHAALARG